MSSSTVCNQNLTTTDSACWEVAEKATQAIISHIQPSVVSDKKRNDVIRYMQGLIGGSLGCKVLQYGSVPLKTYLPDGDIDLSVFGAVNVEEDLARQVLSILHREERNMSPEFVISDVQLICAEVKLVKCLVQNIVVDISFGQSGGVSSLCFLEQVDRLIGKSNLFKRSIIVVKAWCYYESRILGAFHGLLSTYAMEILVLYIFHLFHSSLNGPLAVLYKFLDHFSKFDWGKYGVSLAGRIQIASLPQLVAEVPENAGDELLINNEFLRSSMELFADHSGVSQKISQGFPKKHLNIVDPIRETNNIGRSVNQGNFLRIQSAFKLGARRLGKILTLPEEGLADEIHKFFSNTLNRPGNDLRPDIQDHVQMTRYNRYGLHSQSLEETCQEDKRFFELGAANLRGTFMREIVDFEDSSSNEVNNVHTLSKDVAVSKFQQGPKISDHNSKSFRGIEGSISHVGKADHTPDLYCSRSSEDRVILDQDDTTLSGSGVLNSVSVDGFMVPVSKETVSPNVSGVYGEQRNTLRYGPQCYEQAGPSRSAHTPQLISQFQNKVSFFYPAVSQMIVPNTAFCREVDRPARHGTGTYIPNTVYYRPKFSNPRRKNQARIWAPRNNPRHAVPPVTNVPIIYELSEEQFPSLPFNEKPQISDLPGSDSPDSQVHPTDVESINFVKEPSEGTSHESNKQQIVVDSFTEDPKVRSPKRQMHRQVSALDVTEDGDAEEPIIQLNDDAEFPSLPVKDKVGFSPLPGLHLKDEVNFPPLTIREKR